MSFGGHALSASEPRCLKGRMHMNAPFLRPVVALFVFFFAAISQDTSTPDQPSRLEVLEELENITAHLDQIAEEYRNGTPKARRDAMKKWYDEHLPRIQVVETALAEIL